MGGRVHRLEGMIKVLLRVPNRQPFRGSGGVL